VIAVVLSYEVLNLERERPLVTVRETAEEPVLEEAVPSEPSKAPLDAVTGEAEEPIDPDKFDVGGTPRRKRPSSTPPEAAAPTPASARKAAPTGTARALHESKKVKEGADIPESPEPAPTALVGAARVRARVESEDAPVAVLAEEMRKPVGAPAPPTAAPEVPKLEASEPAPRESSEHEGVVDEAGKLEKYAVMEQAARGRRGLNQVAFREEDRETTSASGNEAECRVLRDSLSPSMEVDEQEEIRYQLAKCSFRLYQSRQTEDDRRQAREDASAYLEIAPRGERADEIRELLDRIK
jgi:hypothetical protein